MTYHTFEPELRKVVMNTAMDLMMSPKEKREIVKAAFNKYPHAYLPVNSKHQLQVKRSEVLQQLIKSGFLKQIRTKNWGIVNYRTSLVKA